MARGRAAGGVTAVAAGLVVLLAGCASSGSEEPEDDATSAGPLSAYFQQIGGEYDEAKAAEESRRAEEMVAECMAEEGFEYTPMDTSGQMVAVAEPTGDMPAYDSVEYAEQYGYGATTWEDMPGAVSEPVEWVDPNQEYVEAMSQTERDAYYAALYGEQTAEPDENGVVEWDWTQGGCQGKAQHEVYEAGQPWDDETIKGLQDEMNALYEGMMSDPRVADVNAEWSACMTDAGYAFDKPEEASQSIYDELNELYQASGDKGGEPDEAAMSELRDQEIATAVADRTCQDEVRYTARQQEVMFDLEQQFVDAHKAELDAWVAKYADQD